MCVCVCVCWWWGDGGRKFGEVLRVKFDKRTPSSAWVTYKDKKAARVASRKGFSLAHARCKTVRVRPDIPASNAPGACVCAEEGRGGE